MPKYKYEAVSLTGEKQVGEHTAANKEGVIDFIRGNEWYHTKITLIEKEPRRTTRKVPVKILAGFCAQMSTLMRAGVPISKSLEILTQQQENPTFKKILDDVYNSVLRGVSLSESFAPYEKNFPSLMINMIEAGEASGMLDVCLDRAGTSFTRIAKLNAKVKNAMIYPTIILIVLGGLLALMLLVVLPTFADMYADADAALPPLTQGLLNLSDFLQRRWYVIAGIIVAIIIGFKWWRTTDRGDTAFNKFKLRIPVVKKLIGKIYAARFCRTLASLGSAGVPLTQSLVVTARSVLNRFMEKELYKTIEGINRGELLSTQLERMGLLPPMIVYMVRLGEETGTMDELLMQAADYYDEESEVAMTALTAMLEPLMIVLMAAIVVPILLAVVMPMFDMANMMM